MFDISHYSVDVDKIIFDLEQELHIKGLVPGAIILDIAGCYWELHTVQPFIVQKLDNREQSVRVSILGKKAMTPNADPNQLFFIPFDRIEKVVP